MVTQPVSMQFCAGLKSWSRKEFPPAYWISRTAWIRMNSSAGTDWKVSGIFPPFPPPTQFFSTANEKNGSFRLKVTLPYEKTWLLTLTVVEGDVQRLFHAFDPVKYSQTLLPLTFDSPVPETLTANETVISGTTDKGVTIQCIVSDGGKTNFTKQIKTNGTGRFSFKVPTADEADYHFTLVFSKKGFDTNRITFDASRSLSEEDRRTAIQKSAVRPSYSNLMNKSEKYIHQASKYPGTSITLMTFPAHGIGA